MPPASYYSVERTLDVKHSNISFSTHNSNLLAPHFRYCYHDRLESIHESSTYLTPVMLKFHNLNAVHTYTGFHALASYQKSVHRRLHSTIFMHAIREIIRDVQRRHHFTPFPYENARKLPFNVVFDDHHSRSPSAGFSVASKLFLIIRCSAALIEMQRAFFVNSFLLLIT